MTAMAGRSLQLQMLGTLCFLRARLSAKSNSHLFDETSYSSERDVKGNPKTDLDIRDWARFVNHECWR